MAGRLMCQKELRLFTCVLKILTQSYKILLINIRHMSEGRRDNEKRRSSSIGNSKLDDKGNCIFSSFSKDYTVLFLVPLCFGICYFHHHSVSIDVKQLENQEKIAALNETIVL